MRDNQKLPRTIITPTTKGEQGEHDAPLSASDVVSRGLLTQRQWDDVCAAALKIFARGREIADSRGLILVDTKYEFGFDGDGNIVLADEIHTPDSSRYWLKDTYAQRFESGALPDTFDKDFVRRWVAARCDPYRDPIPAIPGEIILQAAAIYIGAYEKITGQVFALPDISVPPLQRLRGNLAGYF
jgi:phosphoribosylaminoimidazole-succinocarboxamide synthase